MNNKKQVVDSGIEQLEAEIESFMKSICFDDAIRMQFLEQSAKYLGIFVENKTLDYLDNKTIN